MKRALLTILTLIFYFALLAQPVGYLYKKTITIDASKIDGNDNHTDFPLLLEFTDTDLMSVANGGHIYNSNGYDIKFTLGCAQPLYHQIEKYDATAGKLLVWVKIPNLSVSTDTEINMYYGNSSITGDQSSTAVWSSGYLGVWHLDESPAGNGTTIKDVGPYGFDGTSKNSPSPQAGIIDNSLSFGVADRDHIQVVEGDSSELDMVSHNGLTLSAWVKVANYNNNGNYEIINKKKADAPNNNYGYAFRIINDNTSEEKKIKVAYREHGGLNNGLVSTVTINDRVWTHVAVSYSRVDSSATIYINGQPKGVLNNLNLGNYSLYNQETFNIGRRPDAANKNNFKGNIDEVRVCAEARSADWLSTEYTNQTETIFTVSSESNAYTSNYENDFGNNCSCNYLEDGDSVNFYSDVDIERVGNIVDITGSGNLETVEIGIKKDADASVLDDIAILRKTYTIEPINETDAKISLFFSTDDYNNLVAKAASTANPISSTADLLLTKTMGNGNCTNGPVALSAFNPVDALFSGPVSGIYTVTFTTSTFSTFNIHAKGELLPVELIEFDAVAMDNEINLSWVTASEINNSHFIIQQSVNGLDWQEIGKVNGEGTTNETKYYSFSDDSNFNGTSYYRLKQIDFDGTFDYSSIRMVNLGAPNDIQLSPNPANEFVSIQSKNIDISKMRIVDNLGRIVPTPIISLNTNQVTLDVSNLSKGSYYVQITDQNATITKRLVIVK